MHIGGDFQGNSSHRWSQKGSKGSLSYLHARGLLSQESFPPPTVSGTGSRKSSSSSSSLSNKDLPQSADWAYNKIVYNHTQWKHHSEFGRGAYSGVMKAKEMLHTSYNVELPPESITISNVKVTLGVPGFRQA